MPARKNLTDSELDRLREVADEQHHIEWLKARRKQRAETIRGWITWITAAWVLKDLLWRDLAGWVKDLWK